MFCSQCGAEIQPGYHVCPKCGRVVQWPTSGLAQSRLERHLRILAVLWMLVGTLWLIPALALMGIASWVHIEVPSAEAVARSLGPFVLFMLAWSLLIVGAGGICVGWGLTQHQSWARLTAIILGVLALFHPPLGTALGVYTLWVLLADEGGLEYRRMARAA